MNTIEQKTKSYGMRGLSVSELVEAFSSECKTILGREIRLARECLEPYYQQIWGIKLNHEYDDWTKVFLQQIVNMYYEKDLARLKKLENTKKAIKSMDNNTGISLDYIARAKEVPIEGLYTWEKRKGQMVSCAFHPDQTPSMKINKNNTAKCFSCGFFGDGISFVKKLHNLNFIDAVKYLNKK